MSSEPAIKLYDAPKPPVTPFRYPTTHAPAKDPSAPRLLIKAIAPPETFFGRISVMNAKNGPYGAYMAAPATTSKTNEIQK